MSRLFTQGNGAYLEVKLRNDMNERIGLSGSECNFILDKARKDVSYQEALDVIINKMYNDRIDLTVVDIYERNKSYAPAKKMTVKEIEKELGYRIEIIS